MSNLSDSNLVGPAAELHMTVQITRKATGLTETHHLVGTLDPAQLETMRQHHPDREVSAPAQKD